MNCRYFSLKLAVPLPLCEDTAMLVCLSAWLVSFLYDFSDEEDTLLFEEVTAGTNSELSLDTAILSATFINS